MMKITRRDRPGFAAEIFMNAPCVGRYADGMPAGDSVYPTVNDGVIPALFF